MDTLNSVLEVLALVLIVVGIIFRKKSWGPKVFYLGLGMFIAFLPHLMEGFNSGYRDYMNNH